MDGFERCVVSGFQFIHRKNTCRDDCLYFALGEFSTSPVTEFLPLESREDTYQCIEHALIHVCHTEANCRLFNGCCIISRRPRAPWIDRGQSTQLPITEFDLDREINDPDVTSGLSLLMKNNKHNWMECVSKSCLVDRCPSVTDNELRDYVFIAYCVFLNNLLVTNTNKRKSIETITSNAETLTGDCINCIKDRIQPLHGSKNYLPSNKTARSSFRTQLSRMLAIRTTVLMDKFQTFFKKHYDSIIFI